MSRHYLLHGSRHRPNGSDPVFDSDPILFNTDNEGGWLYVVANDSTDISFGESAIVLDDETGQGICLHSTDGSDASSIYILPTDILFSSAGTFSISGVDGTTVYLQAGSSFVVVDHLNAPIFQVDEDGTVHIKTGGTIVADL